MHFNVLSSMGKARPVHAFLHVTLPRNRHCKKSALFMEQREHFQRLFVAVVICTYIRVI